MLIREAIARATSEHHVSFLVAAYVENLQHRGAHGVLPLHLTALPINGINDVQRRRGLARAILAMFLRDSNGGYRVMREYHDIFATAADRIFALRQAVSALPA